MAITQTEIQAIAAEVVRLLAPMLGAAQGESAPAQPALDPDRVRYEDSCLLDARRTMTPADYTIYHAGIMAGRARTLGQYSTAERLMAAARAKAVKLAKQM